MKPRASRVAFHHRNRPLGRVAAMSESQFWRSIEPLGWGSRSTDYTAMKKRLMQAWSKEEAEAAGDLMRKLRGLSSFCR